MIDSNVKVLRARALIVDDGLAKLDTADMVLGSAGIPPGEPGPQGWSLGVWHAGLNVTGLLGAGKTE